MLRVGDVSSCQQSSCTMHFVHAEEELREAAVVLAWPDLARPGPPCAGYHQNRRYDFATRRPARGKGFLIDKQRTLLCEPASTQTSKQ